MIAVNTARSRLMRRTHVLRSATITALLVLLVARFPRHESLEFLYTPESSDLHVREGRDARFEIVVDHQSALFQTGHRTNLESIETYNKPESGNAYFDSTEGRVYNSESGNRPFLVHFNGGKAAFEEVARSFGLLQVSQ